MMADHKLNGVLDARDKISRYGLSRSLAKEENYDFYEELLQPSQLEGFLGHKKAKGMYVRDYDYHGGYDCYYQNEDYYKRHGNYDGGFRFNKKFNIPEFDGRMNPDEFLDWLNMVEHVFEYYDSPEREKVKLVATKMCKTTSIWWKTMKRQRERDGKKKIQTWGKMKKELKRKYLPFYYCQDIYLIIQNFKQRDLSVEEYSAKFVNLIIKGDLQEAEEICIAHHYIAGLRSGIARVIFLQPYNSLQDVMKLALKVGTKKKYGNSTTTKSVANEGFVEGSNSWNPSGTKTTPTKVKSVAQQELASKSKTCFKCQGLGHIDSECPNQKAFALIEEDEAKEEDVEQVIESNHVQEDDENKSLLSKSKLDVEEVVESNHIQEDEEKSSLPSNFDLEIKDVSDATTLVIEETESEKEFSQEAKSIIEYVDVMPEETPHDFPPMEGTQHQIDLIPGLVFPNKLASMKSPKELEEFKTQVNDFLDKGLVQESEWSYVVPTMFVHEKDGSWSMCFDCQALNNILIHEEARFNKGKRVKQYEKQAYEGYQRLVFDPGGWIRLHKIQQYQRLVFVPSCAQE